VLTAADIIRLLDLAPHPEGGHFRETFRDDPPASADMRVAPAAGRAASTAIYFLLARGERPQTVVPARAWQAAESLGEWTLAGCTVAPGFEFAGFELAPKGWAPST
jgi:predicted cupin superfamily sugar epimerase